MSWTQTYTGRKFDPERVDEKNINIIDIAHALSNLCRFAGHTDRFYSVAQHSVLVSGILEEQGLSPECCFAGLLHDATEAYLIDLPQPIKRLPQMEGYCAMEEVLAGVIASRFGFAHSIMSGVQVKRADLIALATEARDLVGDPQDWQTLKGVTPVPARIKPLLPNEAKVLFLERFLELKEMMEQ